MKNQPLNRDNTLLLLHSPKYEALMYLLIISNWKGDNKHILKFYIKCCSHINNCKHDDEKF
jgi:hypothetical protein